ncbi:MAG: beta-ketoacyl synthase [Bacteroidetes bacterium]|nr:beta-ketoacyl synthase [Bacteroidota bacterium]MBU1720262.1 beta-ketoacyl synthase [Bacteroidota bacterium]
MKSKPLAIISGIGAVSPLGCTVSQAYGELLDSNVRTGRVAVGDIFYPVIHRHPDCVQVVERAVRKFALHRHDQSVQLAATAAEMAALQSGWSEAELKSAGVITGSSRGLTQKLEETYNQFVDSGKSTVPLLTSPLTTSGNMASTVASCIGCYGPVFHVSMTCSTGGFSLLNAVSLIGSGMCKRVLAGASEFPITPFSVAQLAALGVYAKNTDDVFPSRPLADPPGNSVMLGEAAVMLALEEFGKKKNALAVIERVGYGFEKPPSLTGISANAAQIYAAMKMAADGVEVDAVILHAPGTAKGDAAEMQAVKQFFGDKMPFLTSTKWKTGHTYGTSGLVSLLAAVSFLGQCELPLIPYPNRAQNIQPEKPVRRVLVNTAGFGGAATSVLVSDMGLFG